MRRYRQTVEEVIESLSRIEASWRDEHAENVIQAIRSIPEKSDYTSSDVREMLERDFGAAMTAVRLILSMSKDEFTLALKSRLGDQAERASRGLPRTEKPSFRHCWIWGLRGSCRRSSRRPFHGEIFSLKGSRRGGVAR